jgi:hypothetical protein
MVVGDCGWCLPHQATAACAVGRRAPDCCSNSGRPAFTGLAHKQVKALPSHGPTFVCGRSHQSTEAFAASGFAARWVSGMGLHRCVGCRPVDSTPGSSSQLLRTCHAAHIKSAALCGLSDVPQLLAAGACLLGCGRCGERQWALGRPRCRGHLCSRGHAAIHER